MRAREIRNCNGQLIQRRKYITTKITDGHMCMIQATHTHHRHPKEKCLGTKRIIHDGNQWGYHKTIRHAYAMRKYLEHLILMQCPWHHREQKSFHTKNQINVLHGVNMEYRCGVPDHRWNTMGVTKDLLQTQDHR